MIIYMQIFMYTYAHRLYICFNIFMKDIFHCLKTSSECENMKNTAIYCFEKVGIINNVWY